MESPLQEYLIFTFSLTDFVMSEQKKFPDMKVVHPIICQSKEHFDAYFENATQTGLGVVSYTISTFCSLPVSEETHRTL